tara:strand:+ start:569 stop:775 length:207 start_codon:yes stop_codon:yes gene_type:complete
MKFNFPTKLEDGDVTVFWEFEQDDISVYNSEVVTVMFNGMDIVPILSEETLYELDARAIVAYEEQLND